MRTVHDAVAHADSRSARRDQLVWRLADVVIVHGDDARATVEAAAPGTQVCVIPPDPPPVVTPTRTEARAALGLDERPRVLLLGIIRAYKGVAWWPTRGRRCTRRRPDAELIVVGSLPEPLADFDRLAALDARRRPARLDER